MVAALAPLGVAAATPTAAAAAATNPVDPVRALVEYLTADVIYTLTHLQQCQQDPRDPYCIGV